MQDPSGPTSVAGRGTHIGYNSDLTHSFGRSVSVSVSFLLSGIMLGYAEATLELQLTQEAYSAWQLDAWRALRAAAAEQWENEAGALRARQLRLIEEYPTWDPLSLRRSEREEVMGATLRWLFGPDFYLVPPGVSALYSGADPATMEPGGLSTAGWARVMRQGEFAKFLHQAIEWENILYFPYPYFWDAPAHHEAKRKLCHPDALHWNFMRAGAARRRHGLRMGSR